MPSSFGPQWRRTDTAKRIKGESYTVQSSTERDTWYKVFIPHSNRAEMTCTCKRFRYRKLPYVNCSHISFILLVIAEESITGQGML